MKTTPVTSVREAIELGLKYVIAYRDHYTGNSKGEIYVANEKNQDVKVEEEGERAIHTMYATNDDVLAIQARRARLISLINKVDFSMSIGSPLFGGVESRYAGRKMVFGTWRAVHKSIQRTGASNYDNTFFKRHNKMLACLKESLHNTPYVSTTMALIS